MRQIVLDTETTGKLISEQHRIIEIGCVELHNRRITSKYFHCYVNPQRQSEADALAIHGLTDHFLSDKPLFKDIVSDFLAFINGTQLIIHNAAFDVSFLNYELQLTSISDNEISHYCTVIDTLPLARQLHPGQRNSLDALCKRYAVDCSRRNFHGALLDAELLAKVYLSMTAGQISLFSEGSPNQTSSLALDVGQQQILYRPLRVIYADATELVAHQQCLDAIAAKSSQCLWQTSKSNVAP